MSPAYVAAFLVGCLVGSCLVFVLAGLAMYLLDVRRAIREGTIVEGEAIERNRKREEP